MTDKKFITLHDLETIPIEIASYKEWRQLARSIDGYKILNEIGYDSPEKVREFYFVKRRAWSKTSGWNLNLTELLLVLFLTNQRSRFLAGGENYKYINSILEAISQQAAGSYIPIDADSEWVLKENKKELQSNRLKIINDNQSNISNNS
jgi:hypothetical protein